MKTAIPKDYINFGDYCRNEVGIKGITGYYMLYGLYGYPDLGDKIRHIVISKVIYPYVMIDKGDAIIFKNRVHEWYKQRNKKQNKK